MKWIYAIFRYIYRILKSFYDYLFCTDEELSQEFFQQSESTPVSGGFGSFSTLVIIAQDNMDAIKREEMDAQELQCLLYTQYVRVFMNDLIGGFPQVDILEENANLETEKEEKLKEEVLGRRSDYKNSYYAIQRAIFLRLNIGDLEKNIAESSSALFDEQKTECPEINLDFIFEYYEEIKATYFMNFSPSSLMALLVDFESSDLEPEIEEQLSEAEMQLSDIESMSVAKF